VTWTNRPTLNPGEYPDGADLETMLDQISFLTSPPRFRGRQTVAQTLTSAVFAPVTLDTEDEDNYSGHSTSTNTSRYTAQVAGWYLCSGSVGFVGNATGRRATEWLKNGAVVSGSQLAWAPGVATAVEFPAETILIFLAVGDYVEIGAYQESGGNLNTDVAFTNVQSSMSVIYHSAA
jgi:hypothetical protein